jgi:hypothetical protein
MVPLLDAGLVTDVTAPVMALLWMICPLEFSQLSTRAPSVTSQPSKRLAPSA